MATQQLESRLFQKTITMQQNETSLSPIEVKILHLMTQEHNIKAIAGLLNRTEKSIAGHRGRMLRKTQTNNAVGLILWGIKNNVIVIND
jgi:DNA-binding CsgD family transcriptional regulator